jgi:hypothetical protein
VIYRLYGISYRRGNKVTQNKFIGGYFAALEELSTHEPIFYTQKMIGWAARPASSQKDQNGLFHCKGVQLP